MKTFLILFLISFQALAYQDICTSIRYKNEKKGEDCFEIMRRGEVPQQVNSIALTLVREDKIRQAIDLLKRTVGKKFNPDIGRTCTSFLSSSYRTSEAVKCAKEVSGSSFSESLGTPILMMAQKGYTSEALRTIKLTKNQFLDPGALHVCQRAISLRPYLGDECFKNILNKDFSDYSYLPCEAYMDSNFADTSDAVKCLKRNGKRIENK